jgi:uncharacterized cupin superfamily protein
VKTATAGLTSPTVAAAIFEHADLADHPMPADWVISGNPTTRVKDLASSSRTKVCLWDCQPGQFRWQYGVFDEVVHILEGSVRVVGADGEEQTLNAGDTALFKAGTAALWTVDTYVRKLAVLHDTRSGLRRFVGGVVYRAKGSSGL